MTAEWVPAADIVSLDEAWALFPLAMERANVGIGHLMRRPGFQLRMWHGDQTLLAQAEMTPRERASHVTRSMHRNSWRPLRVAGVTHRMERMSEKSVRSECGLKMGTRQPWDESYGRVVDCMACLGARRSSLRIRGEKSCEELESEFKLVNATWMQEPGVWSRYGTSFSSHPRRDPRPYESEVAAGA